MQIQNLNMKKIALLIPAFVIVIASGCAKFITPEVGSTARPEARITLGESDIKEAMWQTDYATLIYSISGSDDEGKFSGHLEFHRRLTDTYNVIQNFYLNMSFIGSQGNVLSTVDISPMFSFANTIPSNMEIERDFTKPQGTSGIVFSYFGVFMGASLEPGQEWEIFHFPFE